MKLRHLKEINKIKKNIAKERDRLRILIGEVEDIAESCDTAIDCFEQGLDNFEHGIDSLSKYL